MKYLNKNIITYVIFAVIVAVGFGELFLAGVVHGSDKPVNFLIYFLIYYTILSYIFALVIEKFGTKKSLLVILIYGILVETFFFRNISDIVGVIFFGLLYIFLFGVPLLVRNLIFNKKKK